MSKMTFAFPMEIHRLRKSKVNTKQTEYNPYMVHGAAILTIIETDSVRCWKHIPAPWSIWRMIPFMSLYILSLYIPLYPFIMVTKDETQFECMYI